MQAESFPVQPFLTYWGWFHEVGTKSATVGGQPPTPPAPRNLILLMNQTCRSKPVLANIERKNGLLYV